MSNLDFLKLYIALLALVVTMLIGYKIYSMEDVDASSVDVHRVTTVLSPGLHKITVDDTLVCNGVLIINNKK